jgi:transposase InsO family protein
MKAKPSIDRTACCYHNASAGSFFYRLKIELVHQRRWATREGAGRDLFAYLEGYYNRRRIHSALGHRTREQAEQHMAEARVQKNWKRSLLVTRGKLVL